MPLSFLLSLLLLALLAGPAGGAETSGDLRELAGRARWIVIANVAETETLAEGHVFVHHLEAVRTLQGPAQTTFRVVEIKKSPFREYQPGERVLTFLEPAPTHSLLRDNLPEGEYQATVGGRRGTGPLAPPGDAVAAEVVAAYRTLSARKKAGRPLLLRQLASGHDLLAADAVAQLGARTKLLDGLDHADLRAFRTCLESEHVTDATKQRLTRLMAAEQMDGALPLLQAWSPTTPTMLAARAEALAALGAPPNAEELRALLDHPDEEMRRFAVDEIARGQDPDRAAALATTVRTDEVSRVRVAAATALGRVDTKEAAVALEDAFGSDDPHVRVASAAAFKDMTDAETDVALRRLVRTAGEHELQVRALLLLFARGARPDDPEIAQLVREHPDPRLRRLVEEGIESGVHSH